MRTNTLLIVTVLIAGSTFARADLINAFSGYDAVWGIGVSGHQSSYHNDTKAGDPVTGSITGNVLPTLSNDLVSYPHGVGEVPSPGGAVGMDYDQGVLGVAIGANGLSFQLATALDPRVGAYNQAWKTWYGQGDLFLDVADSDGIRHYALINAWAEDVNINRGYFSDAENYRVDGGLVGALVMLDSDDDVALAGGRGAYGSNNAPAGLDLRIYAKGGEYVADGSISIVEVVDNNKTWYVQNWTVDGADLSSDANYDIALHSAASCGNDQIGATFSVPEPASLILTALGLVVTLRSRRLA